MTMLLALSACGTAEPPKTASDSYCLIARPLSFANAPAGLVHDDGNRFDTGETVAEIMQHNAAYDGACGSGQ
ncbi:hypothetical protein GGR43_004078 [Sphingobium jiangsuense]|uniref:Uncharacterized protein n=1 Tax=Sphingobium jiangsuense TaxID=870476 RepID=A0A7W6FSR2_9SPHN|nr:hypothetical protein [Sphingobium jiangsuense]